MGLFDFLKKGKKQEQIQPAMPRQMQERQDRIETYLTEEGRKVFEFFDSKARPGQMYDSTRVVIDQAPKVIEGDMVYDCFVSWFGEGDTVFFEEGRGRQDQYEHVIAGINPGLMETDPEYLKFVMQGLFGKARVERYLETALMSEEEIQETQKEEIARTGHDHTWACGRYIGKVERNAKGELVKKFNAEVGSIMHNTAEMKSARNVAQLKRAKREEIAAKQAELAAQMAELASIGAEMQEDLMH